MSEQVDIYLGVDPGAAGSIAVLSGEYPRQGVTTLLLSNNTERQVWEWLRRIPTDFGIQAGQPFQWFAMLEKVGGYLPGSAGNIGSAMFNFGRSYGFLRGCMVAVGVPFAEVIPAVWQRALGIPARRKTEIKSRWKRRLRQHAEQLFPGFPVTQAAADALLLAEYCRQRRVGLLTNLPKKEGG